MSMKAGVCVNGSAKKKSDGRQGQTSKVVEKFLLGFLVWCGQGGGQRVEGLHGRTIGTFGAMHLHFRMAD